MLSEPQIIRKDESKEYFFDEGCYILELLNTEKDDTLSIARARVSPDTETRLHKLSATVERYIILEGEGKVFLENKAVSEQAGTKVGAGDVVIIPENHPQAIRNTGEKDLIFLVICSPRFVVNNYQEC